MTGPIRASNTSYAYEIGQAYKIDHNRNRGMQLTSKCLAEGSCPMLIRNIFEAQQAHLGRKDGAETGQNCRSKLLVAATIGFLPTMGTRLFRSVVRTLPFVTGISPLYCLLKAHRFDLEGEIKDEAKRVGEEWLDLLFTIDAEILCLAKLAKPDAARNLTNVFTEYYVERIDARNQRDAYTNSRIARRIEQDREIKAAWKSGSPPPRFDAPAPGCINPEHREMHDPSQPLLDDHLEACE
ncbi:MAG: hypothetical protein KDK78_02380 [Chlamydiia bacterium]|nr:hypothetical protein [Chlamydiia bacterium]